MRLLRPTNKLGFLVPLQEDGHNAHLKWRVYACSYSYQSNKLNFDELGFSCLFNFVVSEDVQGIYGDEQPENTSRLSKYNGQRQSDSILSRLSVVSFP